MNWHWQYLIPPLLTILNVDWILMPIIQGRGVTGWLLFAIVSALAVAELFCWLHWAIWFRSVALVEFAQKAARVAEVQEAIALGKEIRYDLKETGMWEKNKEKVIDYCFATFKKATNENNRFIRWVKRGGGLGLLILGIFPEPGTRTLGAICCGVMGWKKGIYPLAIGNIMRVGYMVGLWHLVFKLFS